MGSILDNTGFLTTSDFHTSRYVPDGSFSGLECDIRSCHLDHFTPLQTQDTRFTDKSWMNVHAWALSYLHLWCIRPQSIDGSISLKQRVGAIILKPFAALLDMTVDSVIFCCWSVVLIDAIIMNLLSKLFNQPATGIPLIDAVKHISAQGDFLIKSLERFFFQPPNVVLNLLSPTLDGSYLLGLLPGFSYIVQHKGRGREVLLDQGRVQYLKEHLGWKHVSDAILKSAPVGYSTQEISYWEQDSKIYIQVSWSQFELVVTDGIFDGGRVVQRLVKRSSKNH